MELVTQIKNDTGRCVACALCLPKCPTYRKTENENESPRGRIALARALASGELDLTPKLEQHLSLCLSCRACEAVCPSQVPYGRIIDNTRALIHSQHKRTGIGRSLLRWLTNQWLIRPQRLRRLTSLLRLYQRSGLQTLLRASGVLKLLRLQNTDALLPPLPRQRALATHTPAQGDARGRVALFCGCIASVWDQATLQDSIKVLTTLGYAVDIPAAQGCCGALHQHNGDVPRAKALAQHNLQAFADIDPDPGWDAIITSASACGVQLRDYEKLVQQKSTQHFTRKVTDIMDFLQRIPWPEEVELKPLAQRITVHQPCSQHQQDAVYALLQRLPEAEIVALPDNQLCCGGAGTYPLSHPDMAARLRQDKLAQLRQLQPDVLVSTNIGCALHLAAGIRAAKLEVEVVHPISLIARQM